MEALKALPGDQLVLKKVLSSKVSMEVLQQFQASPHADVAVVRFPNCHECQ